MSAPIYEEIKHATSIIDLIARDTNSVFTGFKIYGSIDKPLYPVNDIAQLLEIKNVDSVIKQFQSSECIVAQISNGDKSTNVRLLTEHGLYRFLFINNTPVGEIFRAFVYKVLDELRIQRVVHLDAVQAEMKKEFSAEIKRATEYLQLKIQNLEIEVSANAKTVRRSIELAFNKEQEAADLSQHTQSLMVRNNQLKEQLLRAELNNQTDVESDEALFEYLRDKYMKIKVFIFLMPCKDGGDDDYNCNNFDIQNPPDEYELMYYRLSRNDACKKGKIIRELYLEHENQFVDLKAALAKSSQVQLQSTDTYHCELSIIIECYLDVRAQPIIEKRKVRKNEVEEAIDKHKTW